MIDPISAFCVLALAKVSEGAIATLGVKELTGTLMSGVLGNRTDAGFCKLLKMSVEHFSTNVRVPKNHDLFKGMVAAHRDAFGYYANTLVQQAQTPAEQVIARKIVALSGEPMSDDVSLVKQLDTLVTPLIAGAGDLTLDKRRSGLVDVAAARLAAWIEQKTGEQLTPHFKALLTETAGNGRASWAAMFQLWLSEKIKGDTRYSAIFLASNTAEILGRTITIQDIAEAMAAELHHMRDQLDLLIAGMVRLGDKQDLTLSGLSGLSSQTDEIGVKMGRVEALLIELLQQGKPQVVDVGAQMVGLVEDEDLRAEALTQLDALIPEAREAIGAANSTTEGLGAVRRITINWLNRYIAPALRERANPYKKLAYFNIADGSSFYGRASEIAQAEVIIDNILAGTCRPAALCIGGRSGAGKSSFLRAGVLSRVSSREDCAIVVLRPEDLPDDDALPAAILDAIVDQTDLPIPPQAMARIARIGASQAVQLVCDAVGNAADHTGRKLIFAFDQFEEVVDYWESMSAAHADKRMRWAPMFEIMAKLTNCGHAAVLYTLESRRSALIGKCHTDAIFDQARVAKIALTNPSERFFTEIIQAPFAAANHHLSPSVIRKLLDEVEKLERHDEEARGLAALPLLSLKLAKLFDYVSQRFAPVEADRLNWAKPEDDDSGFVTPADLSPDEEKFDFAISNEIGLLASAAWFQSNGTEQPDPPDLDFFLPFVGVAEGADLLRLRAVPADSLRYSESILLALRKVRLLEESRGRYRLIHEAVLQSWEPTRDWLEKHLPLLRREARFLDLAKGWAKSGRAPITDADLQQIADSGELLCTYRLQWCHPKSQLDEDQSVLRDYCLALFSRTETAHARAAGRSHLAIAALYGLTDTVRRLLELSPEAVSEESGPRNATPLHQAAWGYPDVVELLLKNEANPHAQDAHGFTAIASAIWGDQEDAFRLLLRALKSGPPTELQDTLLHACAAAGRTGMCKYLIEHEQADPTALNGEQRSATHIAAICGRRDTFSYLANLSSPFATDERGHNCWHIACEYGHIPILEAMSDLPGFSGHEMDCAEDGRNGLHLAASNQKAAAVRWLLRYPALNTPVQNAEGVVTDTPLTLALRFSLNASESHKTAILQTVVALLADPATDVNMTVRGRNALSMAERYPLVETELLADERLDLRPTHERAANPVTIAGKRGLWNYLRSMLERIDADLADANPTPLEDLAALKSLPPDDIYDFAIGKWPPDAERAAELLGRAVGEGRQKSARRLLDRAAPLTDEHRPALLSAVAQKMDDEFVRDLAARIPNAWSSPYWGGWTVVHRLCAAQAVDVLNSFEALISADPLAWTAQDKAGRLPADLLAPINRSAVHPARKSDFVWPERGSWDANLRWKPANKKHRKAIGELAASLGCTEKATVCAAQLPFYPKSVRLLRLAEPDILKGGTKIYCLYRDDALVRLNGTSLPIHETNRRAPLNLAETAAQALDYVRFFGFFVRGDEGPFLAYEHEQQTGFPSGLRAEELADVEPLATPAWAIFDREANRFKIMVTVIYADAIYGVDYEVEPSGSIDMVRFFPLTGGLSAKAYAPIDVE